MYGRRSKRPRFDYTDESDNEPLEQSVSLPPNRRLPRQSNCNRQQNINSTEQNTNEEADESSASLANCRLRHGLNEDCLYEIFKFLNVYDLIQLCELDIYFQTFIVKWVICKKLINFTKMEPCWTTNKIFQVFGKTLRKIKIAEENTLGSFERFLNFIIQYCTVGGLTDVELRFRMPTAPTEIMDQSMPFFSNIRRLILHESYTRVSYDEFLTGISASATYLTHLTLEGVNVSGQWLLADSMYNLKELRLHTSKRSTMNIQITDLATFLRTKSKLEVFSYIGNADIKSVVETLISNCTKLTKFIDFHLGHTYSRVPIDITEQLKYRYNFLQQFNGVTTIGLTSYTQCASDLYYPLVKLAARNQVETLKIYIDRDTATILPDSNRRHYSHTDFAHFNRLKSVELQLKYEESDQCELNAEFLCEFMSKLENIEKLNVICEPALRNIHKVLDIASNLKELNIVQVKMKYLPVEMRKIVISIRNNREQKMLMGQLNPTPFRLTVNEQQWRELQVYNDVDIILQSTIEQKDYGHTFKITGA